MTRIAELETFAAVQEAVGAAPLVLLDMWGTYCAPCRALRPILEEIAESSEEWTVIAVNVDDLPAVAETFGVMATPTLVFFKNGVEIDRAGGFIMPSDLTERMKDAA